MSRQFPDGAGITCAVGGARVLNGAWTFAAIVRQTQRGTQVLIAQQASSYNIGGLWLASSGQIQASAGGFGAQFGLTLPLNVWSLIAITKSAGETAPRGHLYRYDTNAWSHATSGDTLGDQSDTTASMELGRSHSDWFYIGRMAVAGVWDRSLSDVEVESLELTLQSWLDTSPAAVWPLNQTTTADPVLDIVGTAHQTSQSGTTVSTDEPPGWSYDLGGGGTVHDASASGVSTSVGSAAVTVRVAAAGAGGSVSTGTAGVTALLAASTAGVSVSSGAAGNTARLAATATGGSVSDGAAAVTTQLAATAAGLSISAGSVDASLILPGPATWSASASGTSTSVGTAAVTALFSAAVSGASLSSGAAALTALLVAAASGMSTSGGTATAGLVGPVSAGTMLPVARVVSTAAEDVRPVGAGSTAQRGVAHATSPERPAPTMTGG